MGRPTQDVAIYDEANDTSAVVDADGRLDANAIVESTGEWLPEGELALAAGDKTQLRVDTAGNLKSRAQILTDEGSWVENWTAGTLPDGWVITQNGTGTSYSIANGKITLNSGTSANAEIILARLIDYPPMRIYTDFEISQRIANQDLYFGLTDVDTASEGAEYARFHFNGTNNKIAICETSAGSGTGNQQTKTITNPASFTDADYIINCTPEQINFSVNNDTDTGLKSIAMFSDKIPGPYTTLYLRYRIKNGATPPASSTSIAISTTKVSNFNAVEVQNLNDGMPLNVSTGTAAVYNLWQSFANAGKGFIVSTADTSIASTHETPFLLIRNPSGSGQTTKIQNIKFNLGATVTGDSYWWRLYKSPTVTANGTALTPVPLLGTQNNTGTTLWNRAPTISANGTLAMVGNVNAGETTTDFNLTLLIQENETFLITVHQANTGKKAAFTISYAEDGGI